MTKEELAEQLNGLNYGSNIPHALLSEAKDNNLVICMGYSDDNMEFSGAINEEYGCYHGGAIYFLNTGTEVTSQTKASNTITAQWCKNDNCLWTYKTDISHVTFNVYEDDDLYCVGIVFSTDDLKYIMENHMTVEEFYLSRNMPVIADKFDRFHQQFDYLDMLDFAEQYAQICLEEHKTNLIATFQERLEEYRKDCPSEYEAITEVENTINTIENSQ